MNICQAGRNYNVKLDRADNIYTVKCRLAYMKNLLYDPEIREQKYAHHKNRISLLNY